MHVSLPTLIDVLPSPPIAPGPAGSNTQAAVWGAAGTFVVLVGGALVAWVMKLRAQKKEFERAGHEQSKEDKTDTIREWKNWSTAQDRRLRKLEERAEDCEDDKQELRRVNIRTNAHVAYLEMVLRAAGIEFTPFDGEGWDKQNPPKKRKRDKPDNGEQPP